jgi:hypothetical protein
MREDDAQCCQQQLKPHCMVGKCVNIISLLLNNFIEIIFLEILDR